MLRPLIGDHDAAIADRLSTDAAPRRAAVFVDKDGTLVEDVPFNVDPARLRWMPGAISGLRMLAHAGYQLVIITNQSGVAERRFSEADLLSLMTALDNRLVALGIRMLGFVACPHRRSQRVAGCPCRKPQPGMLLAASERWSIDLAESWMVGDILNDVEAGKRAGCRTALLDVGNETEWVPGALRTPDLIHRDWATLAYGIAGSRR